MNRRVRRKVVRTETNEVNSIRLTEKQIVDWSLLPDDTVIQLFTCLNLRDRASLSSTCKNCRALSKSDCLWQSLDLRAYKFDSNTSSLLSPRCSNLQKLRFRGAESADAILNLRARRLREINGDNCWNLTDSTLSAIVARHECLESLQLGAASCDRITSDSIKSIALCCANLRKLNLSGIKEVKGDAIDALAKHCPKLTEIGFIDCFYLDETALGNMVSVCFLSVAGTTNVNWISATNNWSKLVNLKGLDVSRTKIVPSVVASFLSSIKSLEVLCALDCPSLQEDTSLVAEKGKLLLTLFNDIFEGISTLFVDSNSNSTTRKKDRDSFSYWRKYLKNKDKNLDTVITWLEWILSHSLLRISVSNPLGLDHFWVSQGASLLISLMQSSQQDVQERAATGLASFVVIDDDNNSIDETRAKAVMKDGGIRLLLNLARSCREGIQSEATKAIANLSVNPCVAKAIAEEGGIIILANMAKSMNKLVAEEAAGGLWNLSIGEEHKIAIAEAGCIKALVDLIIKWSNNGDGVLERASGALANLAADDNCSMEIASVGGVHPLVMLACNCKHEGVQEQVARALANLAAHGDRYSDNALVGQEAGAVEALLQLTRSQHDGVRQEAAGALWNLSFNDGNREAIASAGGVETLVALAHSSKHASSGLKERAAGALWGLSISEAYSIAIGREGGVASLIGLAESSIKNPQVHETIVGALWNLAFNPNNALRIVEQGGVSILVYLCASSLSTMARLMSALALTYMFDGRMDEIAVKGSSLESAPKSVYLKGVRKLALERIEAFVHTFTDPQVYSAAAFSSSAPAVLAQITESAFIQEAGHIKCSESEIGRFVSMLRNPSSVLKACAAFTLLQFTVPGGYHVIHHVGLLQSSGASRVLRAAAAAASAPLEAKVFARIVLRNIEHHQIGSSI